MSDAELEGSLLRIVRKGLPPVTLALITKDNVSAADIASFFTSDGEVDFIVNTPKTGLFEGDAIALCQAHGAGWGGVADGMRAVNSERTGAYVHPEMAFVLRGLNQHSRVDKTEYLDSRRLRVSRALLPTVDLFIDATYQPTAVSVREAIERCSPFDIYVATNPNSHPTPEAVDVARAMGIELLRWKETLGRLHR